MKVWLLFPLVLALSGIPAAGIVCDVLLCVEPDAAPQQNCHDRGRPQDATLSGEQESCTHLAEMRPGLRLTSRMVAGGPSSVPVALATAPPAVAGLPAPASALAGPPCRPPHASTIPLRI